MGRFGASIPAGPLECSILSQGGWSMNAAVLTKIFGRDQGWHGPCTVLMHGEAAVTTQGVDSLLGGRTKQYAPRVITCRVPAGAVRLTPAVLSVLIFQQQKLNQ